jgi:hypothetical protein
MTLPADEGLFRAADKLTWIERVQRDHDLTFFDRCVAVAISSRTKADGVARDASQEVIARFTGASIRGVRRSIERLITRGHLETVGRKMLGRGRATEYRLVRKKRTEMTRNIDAQKADRRDTKSGPGSPPLPNRFQKTSLAPPQTATPAPIGALSDEPDRDLLSEPERCWVAVKERLAKSVDFGTDKVAAWLEKLKCEHADDGEVILIAPTKFMANRNQSDNSEIICREWRAINPSIRRVRIIWRGEAGSAREEGGKPYISLREQLEAEAAAVVRAASGPAGEG